MYQYSKMNRFIKAQNKVYDTVCKELSEGKKATHWMWFIFPQHRKLGKSHRSKIYGLRSATEVWRYLQDPLLHGRFLECVGLILRIDAYDLPDVFSSLDYQKLQSSLTLFHLGSEANTQVQYITGVVLMKHYRGEYCQATQALLVKKSAA